MKNLEMKNRGILKRLRINRYEVIIESLKAELYDKEQEIKRLKAKERQNKELIAKIRNLPTAKKREIGILEERGKR